jgi:hypothetical protein
LLRKTTPTFGNVSDEKKCFQHQRQDELVIDEHDVGNDDEVDEEENAADLVSVSKLLNSASSQSFKKYFDRNQVSILLKFFLPLKLRQKKPVAFSLRVSSKS